MARKKHVALFEVIKKDKRFERKAQSVAAPAAPPAPASVNRHGPDMTARLRTAWNDFLKRLSPRWNLIKPLIVQQSSLLAGAATALAMIGAILLVRHLTRARPGVVPLASNLQMAHPSVLDVPPARAAIDPSGLSPELTADELQAGAQPAAATAQPGARITNFQYVLIQSYLDPKTANDAKNFLEKNGVPSTIERGVKGWRADFYQVIGLQGFPRASGPQYLAYRKSIDALSEKFAPPRSYKRFAPQAIKW